MKDVKDSLKKIEAVLGSFSERFVSNEKDLERMINEYMRINTDYHKESDVIKHSIREQDDLLWQELRRCQGSCAAAAEKRERECKELVAASKAEVKKDMKAWLAFAIVSAIGAIMFSVITKIIQGVLP